MACKPDNRALLCTRRSHPRKKGYKRDCPASLGNSADLLVESDTLLLVRRLL